MAESGYATSEELHMKADDLPWAPFPGIEGGGFKLLRVNRDIGGLTILLGSDDETDMTTLSGVDLYPDVWPHIRNIRNLCDHPFEFYQKCGFVIVGVVPDVNGLGKPDILMAKRVAP